MLFLPNTEIQCEDARKKVAIGGCSCNLFLGKIYLDPSNSLWAVGREKRLKTISET